MMSDQIRLEVGHQPWKPSPDSQMVVEYQYYDIPLSGILEQDGQQYMFVCLDGADENLSVWWYTLINAEQRQWMESATTAEEFHERLHTTNFEGWSRLALATQRHGIFDYEDVPDEAEGMGEAFKALLDRLDSLKDEAHHRELAWA
jgi:hypothetical protein